MKKRSPKPEKKRRSNQPPVSLDPLDFDRAVEGLLRVRPGKIVEPKTGKGKKDMERAKETQLWEKRKQK